MSCPHKIVPKNFDNARKMNIHSTIQKAILDAFVNFWDYIYHISLFCKQLPSFLANAFKIENHSIIIQWVFTTNILEYYLFISLLHVCMFVYIYIYSHTTFFNFCFSNNPTKVKCLKSQFSTNFIKIKIIFSWKIYKILLKHAYKWFSSNKKKSCKKCFYL